MVASVVPAWAAICWARSETRPTRSEISWIARVICSGARRHRGRALPRPAGRAGQPLGREVPHLLGGGVDDLDHLRDLRGHLDLSGDDRPVSIGPI